MDIQSIETLFQNVKDAWVYYFWDYSLCQSKIRFTEEEKTNYVADLNNYFSDTISLFSNFKTHEDYLASFYDTVAILQFMYVQQDLLDELRVIFALKRGDKQSKEPIRSLRNELIGHPISRNQKDKTLISSVFITFGTNGDTLQYLQYHKDNSYKHETKTFQWTQLFSLHEAYLKKHLTEILNKIDEVLIYFKEEIIKIRDKAPTIEFANLVLLVEKNYETYKKENELFSQNNILHCYNKIAEHPRYKHAVTLYLEGLDVNINDRVENIDKFINGREAKLSESFHPKNIKIVFGPPSDKTILPNPVEHLNYEYGKLFSRHPIFGVSYFLKKFENDPDVIEELENMELNQDIDAEYYSSYEYLGLLLKKRGLIT